MSFNLANHLTDFAGAPCQCHSSYCLEQHGNPLDIGTYHVLRTIILEAVLQLVTMIGNKNMFAQKLFVSNI